MRRLLFASGVTGATLSAALVVVLFGASVAFGASPASTPAGGAVEIFAKPGSGVRGPIVVTDAIGDYGTAITMDKNGKPDANGNFVRIALKKGTFEVDSTALNAKTNKLQPKVDRATCSFLFSGIGQVTLFNGTGLYKGIKGTATITITFAGIGPL